MSTNLEKLYTIHHHTKREKSFSILKDDRGLLLQELIGKGKKVLDVGCRDGALTRYFSEGNEVLGVDIDGSALEEARKNTGISIRKLDLNGEWLELGGEKFDVVVAGEVLEHLYYPDIVVEKIAMRLKPEGMFLGSVPNAFSLKNRIRFLLGNKKHTPLEDPTHITQFHIEELGAILADHFQQVEICGLGRYGGLAKLAPGLFAFDLFFICSHSKHE